MLQVGTGSYPTTGNHVTCFMMNDAHGTCLAQEGMRISGQCLFARAYVKWFYNNPKNKRALLCF